MATPLRPTTLRIPPRQLARIARGDFPKPLVDHRRVEHAVREMLLALGEDPDREGLRETPSRVARAWAEMFSGLRDDPTEHLKRQFDHDVAADDAIVLRNIEFSSVCEHHLLPFMGRAHVAYLPSGGKVVGLSKLARTVDAFARRPQLQERLTAQIADALATQLDARATAVVIEGEHLCMRVRGAKKHDAIMVTTAFRGAYAGDRELRREVLALMRGAA